MVLLSQNRYGSTASIADHLCIKKSRLYSSATGASSFLTLRAPQHRLARGRSCKDTLSSSPSSMARMVARQRPHHSIKLQLHLHSQNIGLLLIAHHMA
ncbi:hypothetical protein SADUNF_Sadunf11G0087700 [Salix dunnii]|uniref:Uncharacterized protein n=1 Tax=Salix dunnii TaxID=1413687 RepID=A0A835JKE6_9ROSI|nr:hypothetical protein SADUNF_Sadunf11G0087700 [Salix dunnii]